MFAKDTINWQSELDQVVRPYLPTYRDSQRSLPTASEGENVRGLLQPPVQIGDFLVNDDTVGSCQHNLFDASCAPDGRSVILWNDYRKSTNTSYVQLYSSTGEAIGGNLDLNLGSAPGLTPARVAMADDGSFVIIYFSLADQYHDHVYAKRYSDKGEPLTAPIQVNVDSLWAFSAGADVATDPAGNFAVAWMEPATPDTGAVMVRWFTASGIPLTPPIRVDATVAAKRSPRVAMNNSSSLWVVWEDRRSGNWDVFTQGFLYSNKIGENIRCNDDTTSRNQIRPDIVADRNNHFRIVWYDWCDYSDSVRGVYVQSITGGGILIGQNVKANLEPVYGTPAVGSLTGGDFFVGWYQYLDRQEPAIRRFSSDGNAQNVYLSLCAEAFAYGPLLLAGSESTVLAAWGNTHPATFKGGIEAQIFSENNSPLTGCLWVSDDQASSDQLYPTLSGSTDGSFTIAWTDYRFWVGRIFTQTYSPQGSSAGPNVQIDGLGTQTTPAINAYWPAVSRNCNEITVVTYYSTYSSSGRIMARVVEPSGEPIGMPFDVSEHLGDVVDYPAHISSSCSEGFVITWADSRAGSPDVYCQLLDSQGGLVGHNKKVNTFSSSDQLPWADVACSPNGKFLVVWDDMRDGFRDFNVYGQLYDSLANPIGANFRISDAVSGSYQVGPTVASDSEGNFVVVWWDDRESNWLDVYGQRIGPAGDLLGENFRVNDGGPAGGQFGPEVSMKAGGSFVVAWNDSVPRAREFDRSGVPVGPSFVVPTHNTGAAWQGNVTVGFAGDRPVFAWEDSRRAKGIDIYAKVYFADVVCGDAAGDSSVDIADVVFLVDYIFSGGAAPDPLASAEVNCDGAINIADAVYLIEYIFTHGAAPCEGCK